MMRLHDFVRARDLALHDVAAAVGVLLMALACAQGPPPGAPEPPRDARRPRKLTDSGGRLAWYHGTKHELIAFDAVVDRKRDTEVFVMNPDGSGRKCVTCDADIPKGFVGQPAWHPDGEHLIIQVENENSNHRFYNHVSFGIDNDLWIIRRDGSEAERIWTTERHHAALHPHFDADGTRLVFAERVPTGRGRPLMRLLTPDGENQWAGWRMRVARFDLRAKGREQITDSRTIAPDGSGFYETHGFAPDGRLVYSHTPGGQAFVQDVRAGGVDGSDVRALTSSSETWDEHGQFSKNGDFAWISSRFDRSMKFPGTRPADLRTELFMRQRDGTEIQLTHMNELDGRRVVVSDFDWDREGRRIAFQVADLTGRTRPEIWMIEID